MRNYIIAAAMFLLVGTAVSLHAGTGTIPPDLGCCQFSDENGAPVCNDGFQPCPTPPPFGTFDGFIVGEMCIEATGECRTLNRNVPTLSEMGLIVMAVILGISAYLVLRRRKAQA